MAVRVGVGEPLPVSVATDPVRGVFASKGLIDVESTEVGDCADEMWSSAVAIAGTVAPAVASIAMLRRETR
jgi:hypothetical protein